MTKRATFRLGKLKGGPDEIPSTEELADGIQDSFTVRSEEEDPTTGKTLEFAEKGRNVYTSTEADDYNYCFFTYVTDTSESFRFRENGEEEEDSQTVLEVAWVMYFDNGQFAFQSRDDIADALIPRFIKKRADYEVGDDDFRLDKIGQPEIREWYSKADRISKIKLTHPGESSADLSESAGDLRELAEVANGLSFSTGQGGDEDLRNASLIQEAAETLDIQRMNVKKGDENIVTVKQSGRVEISWNESDWDDSNLTRNRAQTIRNKLLAYLKAIENAREE